jgi:hypothetical protein
MHALLRRIATVTSFQKRQAQKQNRILLLTLCTSFSGTRKLVSAPYYHTHRVQAPPPGGCVSAGRLVLNHGTTNVEPIQKHKPLVSLKIGPISKHKHGLGANRILAMGPDGARNQEQLCWRGPAVYFYTTSCFDIFFSFLGWGETESTWYVGH